MMRVGETACAKLLGHVVAGSERMGVGKHGWSILSQGRM